MEEWKDVVGWEEKYKVSNKARVWNKLTDVEVAQVLAGIPQYKYVNLNLRGQYGFERVHRLVAIAFLENPLELPFVDHIDRDKFNNNLSNLRWVTRSDNNRNQDNTVIIDGLHIKDYVNRYESPYAAYVYILSRTGKGMPVQQALDEYDEFLEYGLLRRKVEFEGVEYYLVDLANKYNVEYKILSNKLNSGWNLWNALHNIPEKHIHSIEVRGRDGVGHWYPSKDYFCSLHSTSWGTVGRLIEEGKYFEEVLEWDGKDHLRQTVLGVTGTIRELCKHFEVSEGAVLTNMQKKGMSLEEALTSPRQRVKRLGINGVYNSPKYWYESFGIDAKRANRWKSNKEDRTFKDTLEYFGVDTSGMEISLT